MLQKNRMLLKPNNSNQNWVGPNFPIDMTWECLGQTNKQKTSWRLLKTWLILSVAKSANSCAVAPAAFCYLFFWDTYFCISMYYTISVCRLFFQIIQNDWDMKLWWFAILTLSWSYHILGVKSMLSKFKVPPPNHGKLSDVGQHYVHCPLLFCCHHHPGWW